MREGGGYVGGGRWQVRVDDDLYRVSWAGLLELWVRCAGFFWILVGVACLTLCSSCGVVGTKPARLKRQSIWVKWAAAGERSGFVFCWNLFTCSL